MPHFFVTPVDGRVVIDGDDARHLAKSLRARPGEVIDAVDPAGFRLRVRLEAVGERRVEGAVEASEAYDPEPRLEVTVALATLPAAALEQALERCTELGAARFVLVAAERSVARGSKPARWAAICREAAMLAGRLRVPEVVGPLALGEAVAAVGRAVRLERDAGALLASLSFPGPVGLFIGPEGGWTEAERALLPDAASLGPRNLRAENAAAAAVAVALARV